MEEEQDVRQIARLMVLYKCVHSLIDALYLVGAIQFHCQSRSLRRPNNTRLRISNSRIIVRKYSVLNRWVTICNTVYLNEHSCDIFMDASSFKYAVQIHLYM